MNMMQSLSVEALEGTFRDTGFHAVVGAGFGLRADARTGGSDNVSQLAHVDLDVLASALVAAFRAHSHINNVMTHISAARWDHIERALHIILNPAKVPVGLSRLEANIVDLLFAERGVTGRIAKPYFETLLARFLPTSAAQMQAHVLSLHETAHISQEANSGSVRIAIAGVVR